VVLVDFVRFLSGFGRFFDFWVVLDIWSFFFIYLISYENPNTFGIKILPLLAWPPLPLTEVCAHILKMLHDQDFV